MKRRLTKIICAGLTATLLMTGSTTAMAGESLSSVFPAAGNARALGEGLSVTAIKAQQIKSDRGTDMSQGKIIEINSDVVINSVLAKAGDSINMSAKAYSSSADPDKEDKVSSAALMSTADDSKESDSSSITRTTSSEPEIGRAHV